MKVGINIRIGASFIPLYSLNSCPKNKAANGLNTYKKEPILPKKTAIPTNINPLSITAWKINHFEINPPIGGIPAIDIIAIKYAR